MYLKNLHLFNFRCYATLDVEFDPKFNIVTGLNGQGKTSLLEGVYLLSSMKSFRMARNPELIRWNEASALVKGSTQFGSISSDLMLKIQSKSKAATVNGKHCRFLSEYIGKLAAVTFSPSDLEIVRGAPEMRRVWLDRMAAISDPLHVDLCSRYSKALTQRNRLLREFSIGRSALPQDFDVWSDEIARLGAEVIHNRLLTVDKSVPSVSEFYGRISGGIETINFAYKSEVFQGVETGQGSIPSVESISQNLKEKQVEMLAKECIVGVTLVGPHRDDIDMALNQQSLKSYGSQGEVRSTAMALRLSEVQMHKTRGNIEPILLVDDFSSELDQCRREFLLAYLERSESQIFLSTTEKLGLGKSITVSEGRISTHGH